jgi:Flp pilus assembly pilin Flp
MHQLPVLLNDRRGVVALEYGLIAVLMAGAIVTGLNSLWSPFSPIFDVIGSFLVSATNAGF